MANRKNFLILAILLGIAGIVIGAVTIVTMLKELSNF
jgi:hypothetical protein